MAAKEWNRASIEVPGESSRWTVSWVFTANGSDDFMYSLE
jgi:hypothetical protein